ncbi:uncharacterized protein BKA55DRAFT_526060, partial [Fusarium redolens]
HQMHNLQNEQLMFLDPTTLCDLDIEGLMPTPVDDEFISSSGILPCPEDVAAKSLTAGSNIHSRVFSAAVRPPRSTTEQLTDCVHLKDPVLRLASLRNRFHHLKYMLDTDPPAYRLWLPRAHSTVPEEYLDVTDFQREAIRANIHVTHLWLQILLLDEIDTLVSKEQSSTPAPQGSINSSIISRASHPAPDPMSWDKREYICEQLLHFLHSMSHSGLEPNGISIVYKVRDVAVSLLSCPDDLTKQRTQRARTYLQEFSRLLSILDVSKEINSLSLQSWIDISRDKYIILQ